MFIRLNALVRVLKRERELKLAHARSLAARLLGFSTWDDLFKSVAASDQSRALQKHLEKKDQEDPRGWAEGAQIGGPDRIRQCCS